jgi:hypothetical protein
MVLDMGGVGHQGEAGQPSAAVRGCRLIDNEYFVQGWKRRVLGTMGVVLMILWVAAMVFGLVVVSDRSILPDEPFISQDGANTPARKD